MGRGVLVTEVKEAGHCPQVEVGEGFTNLLLESGTSKSYQSGRWLTT